jgi:hypothetical protein
MTKKEEELLQLCKDIYAHFTKDDLTIAKRIIAFEENKPTLEVKTVATGNDKMETAIVTVTPSNTNESLSLDDLPF